MAGEGNQTGARRCPPTSHWDPFDSDNKEIALGGTITQTLPQTPLDPSDPGNKKTACMGPRAEGLAGPPGSSRLI